jgi:hypothetical protein
MATLKKSRTSQDVQCIEFSFEHDDTMANTAGTSVDFGATNTSATSFDVIGLPVGAVVVGGEFVRDEAFDAATYTVKIGDAVDDDRYLASADLKAVGRSALLLTGYETLSTSRNIRVNITAADACTTGIGKLRVLFMISDRGGEVTGG